MSLETRVNDDIKLAMKERRKDDLRGLRAIKGAIQLARTDGSGQEIDEAKETQMLQKLVKSRRDSLAIYEKEGREDLAETERQEISTIEEYLPKPISQEGLARMVASTILQMKAKSVKDMGPIMAEMQLKLAGRADGKTISAEVRRQLAEL